MKKFSAKVIVRMKPTVKDIKGLTLKSAIESFIPIADLSCNVGSVYFLKFNANSEAEALHTVEKISQEILSNEVIETYEIRSLEEIYE
ncbi:MAG: phosphoribosylformylglycinamidine synthase subunit PurS [Candidatus Gastranaerophilales bacterium]|nr:phosphoribosylformylglycinamidine synthase subunit PurS [Candidatus Gastranaerophilales bacterium]